MEFPHFPCRRPAVWQSTVVRHWWHWCGDEWDMSVCPQPGKLRTDGRTIDSSEVGVESDVARCINRLRRRKSAIRYFSPGGALVQILHSPTLALVCFFILILSRFLWVTGNHISQSVTSGCNQVELPCRKLVPVGSIAIDKSLVAGIEVCLQNKLPIIKA